MSKQIGSIPNFEEKCLRVAENFCTSWADKIRCYYDGSEYSKRDFVLRANHSWGTAYCDWSYKKNELKNALKEIGAINIIGKIEYNYIDIAFDINPKKIKEYKEN